MNDFSNLLFLDIETAAAYKSYEALPERMQKLWDKKAAFLRNPDDLTPSELYGQAAIYSEFGKVISIAVGFLKEEEEGLVLRIKDISGHDEIELLNEFKALIEEKFNPAKLILCAHNGKEFDFPYIARRMVINNIAVPKTLQLSGKKPWEIPHLDTLDMWKFGDYKHYTSLDLLAAILDIATSKDDIDGSQVNHVYYHDNDLERIAQYCKKDVAVLVQVYLRIQQLPALDQDRIFIL
uniref:3'-5' exonuclease n=1 Tax=Roseivirga sp. TaxID=1964215 RepID=UPI004047B7E7